MPDPHKKESTTSACVISLKDLKRTQYEGKMDHFFGIGENCGSTQLNMLCAFMESGEESRAHFHIRSDIAWFVIEGECTHVTWDQDFNRSERTIRKGDFVFVPRGTVHKDINNSGARFGLVSAYNNVGTGPETLKVYVEPPIKK